MFNEDRRQGRLCASVACSLCRGSQQLLEDSQIGAQSKGARDGCWQVRALCCDRHEATQNGRVYRWWSDVARYDPLQQVAVELYVEVRHRQLAPQTVLQLRLLLEHVVKHSSHVQLHYSEIDLEIEINSIIPYIIHIKKREYLGTISKYFGTESTKNSPVKTPILRI